MFETHGPHWVAWQEVWLDGLRTLQDRHVIVVAESGNFYHKFKRPTSDDENKQNCFDAKYELPTDERAECILDWERRHVALCAAQNKLKIWFVKSDYGLRAYKPEWYLLPVGFAKQDDPNESNPPGWTR